MKWLWLLALWPTLAVAQQFPASPNDGNTDNVIKQKCEFDWPNDFRMRVYCIRQQQEAARQLSGASGDPLPVIEQTPPSGVPLFEQGPFKPAAIHDGYNRPLRKDGYDYR